MSQFDLPDHNDNVLEERIEWDSIIELEMLVILETRHRSDTTFIFAMVRTAI